VYVCVWVFRQEAGVNKYLCRVHDGIRAIILHVTGAAVISVSLLHFFLPLLFWLRRKFIAISFPVFWQSPLPVRLAIRRFA